MPKILNKRVLVMKKSNLICAVKEVAKDLLLAVFVCFILVFPFALVWFCMCVQQILR